VVHPEAPDYGNPSVLLTYFALIGEYAYLPGIGQGNKVININITRGSPRRTVIRRDPVAASDGTSTRALYDICPVALEHYLPSVAAPTWIVSMTYKRC
jgi:hypothetical protein